MNPANKSEIKAFLDEFKVKMNTFDIIFKDRKKNEQALYDIGITALQRRAALQKLKVDDYYRGPINDEYDPGSLPFWEFGVTINNIQIFIKISLWKSKQVLCISFHPAEHKMNFPYK